MTIAIDIALYIVSGWGSQYREGIMRKVIENRQAGRTAYSLPAQLPDVDGFVAWPWCHDIGKIVELRQVGGLWESFLIADCPHDQATRNWMTGNGILVEVDYATALRWDVVGRAAPIEQRVTYTRYKPMDFLWEAKSEH